MGKKWGLGKLTNSDGSIYEGEFYNGTQTGSGKQIEPEPKTIQTNFFKQKIDLTKHISKQKKVDYKPP